MDMVQVSPIEFTTAQRLRAAEQAVADARSLAARDLRTAAAQRYRDALAIIGASYQSAGLRDDTGTKLALAERCMEQRDWVKALVLFDRVAMSRLTLLGEKIAKH